VIRLVLVDGGLHLPELQHVVTDVDGTVLARLDLAYVQWRIAIEADGRAVHDEIRALYRDRQRSNDVELAGWHVLRFTWYDATVRPSYVVQTVADALASFRPAA
jgi:very-short-patch-repair endonuclease